MQVNIHNLVTKTFQNEAKGDPAVNNLKYIEFLRITAALNSVHITPLLMGSVGFELVTGMDWQAADLDIHVPGDERGWAVAPDMNILEWEKIVDVMESLGYQLVDLHEHEFRREDLSVEFGIIDTLPNFAGISLTELQLHQVENSQFYLLDQAQYLKVYHASSKDSYRAENNNDKDLAKIAYLQKGGFHAEE